MTDETNLDMSMEETLFDEPAESPKTTEEPVEQQGAEGEADPQGAETTEPQGSKEEPAVFKVKYMGRELEMTADQLVVNAQKGMDYDRIRQERDALKNAPELQLLDTYAAENGMTRAEFVQYLQRQQETQAVAAQVKQGVPEEVAKQLFELRRENEARKARELEEAQAQAQRKLYADFVREYPDVKEFPEEVRAAIQAGETPLSAYRAYEVKELREALAAQQQAAANRAKAVGSPAGDAPPEDPDEFLAGFMSELN